MPACVQYDRVCTHMAVDVATDRYFLFQKLRAIHTKATKDPDPFHQLYEQKKGMLRVERVQQYSQDRDSAAIFTGS